MYKEEVKATLPASAFSCCLSRYQCLDYMVVEREKANVALREELLKYQRWCHELVKGRMPEGLKKMLSEHPAPGIRRSNKCNKCNKWI